MKNTMKRTLGLFAAALLTMSLALSVYASGHDLTFIDKGNRMHVKDKTVHVQTYYPYEYYVLDAQADGSGTLCPARRVWSGTGKLEAAAAEGRGRPGTADKLPGRSDVCRL